MDGPSTLGELLRRHRLSAGLTQEALAHEAGLSARGIADLERGVRRCPYPDTVDRLAAALHLDAHERSRLLSMRRRGGPVDAPTWPWTFGRQAATGPNRSRPNCS